MNIILRILISPVLIFERRVLCVFNLLHKVIFLITYRCRSLVEALVVPLQDRMDDWKRAVAQLEKDRARGNFQGHIVGFFQFPVCYISRVVY